MDTTYSSHSMRALGDENNSPVKSRILERIDRLENENPGLIMNYNPDSGSIAPSLAASSMASSTLPSFGSSVATPPVGLSRSGGRAGSAGSGAESGAGGAGIPGTRKPAKTLSGKSPARPSSSSGPPQEMYATLKREVAKERESDGGLSGTLRKRNIGSINSVLWTQN